MKRKINPFRTLGGCIFLSLLVAVVVTVAVLTYVLVEESSGGNKAVIAGVMFSVVIVLSVVCTLLDYLRRKFTVEETVNKILEATDKIASGDFSVRLEITHSYRKYDEYDYIMENLNKMAAELSKTEVLHTDFISNVSHELKTPLAVIQNYATSLQNKNLDEEARINYAATLAAASGRLTALITNILKLNKLENQGVAEKQEVNLSESLAECVIGFEEPIERKKLQLECDIDEDVKIISSPSGLEIVWNNLLSNAIKFTEDGGKITVTLKQKNGKAIIKVADTGCGISAETGKRIFEKFYQGDTSHSGEGNGLGLALVKKVIDILGGEISVESETGKGSVFTVVLNEGNR